MTKRVTIGLVGYGVVGAGTMQLLRQQRADIEARVGAQVFVKYICSRKKKKSSWIGKDVKQTNNWRQVVNDPEVDCVVEVMGGTNPAKELVLSSLKAGKHVVTANKAILAKHWNEIFSMAQLKGKLVYFEAAVGGGVPIVQALNEGLAGNKIDKIVGILNGTTNYIFTRMQESKLSYKQALKEAQRLGFAESNPSFDVDGIDAAQKISILASLAAGQWINPNEVHCEGISKLRPIDMYLIKEKLHRVIKLLAIAEQVEGGWVCRVHPSLVPRNHPFANVRNEYNAVLMHGNAAGDVMLYGKGAGRFPTSSAVVSDIIFLSRQIANKTAGKLPYVSNHDREEAEYADMGDLTSKYYLRLSTADKPGVLARITAILGRNEVSIASVYQDTFDEFSLRGAVPILFLTHETREADMQSAVREINKLSTVRSASTLLRME